MRRNFVRLSAISLGAWILGIACDNSQTLVLDPNPATRVVIEANTCSSGVETCAQCLLKADAFDKNSKPAQFPTLIWSSLNESLATVDQAGRVSGWRMGDVTIRVAVQETGASDEQAIHVRPNSHINCTPPNP